ncbi:MAG: 2-oxo acid dehydrogenase subunit E2 [Schleiferiaceae bacterium]|nr:2-oxo acid dehydrogenase subunit E2 [Schleiferiaceae bacterium]
MTMFELTMPKMGESVAEATITQWLKNEGDSIALDESVLTIATDKVDSDIPSPVAGVLVKKLFNENDVIQVGQVIAHIDTGDGKAAAPAASNQQPVTSNEQPKASNQQPVTSNEQPTASSPQPATSNQQPLTKGSGNRFYSPLVRSMATQEGVSHGELDSIDGSGQDGRVTKQDLLAYLAQRASGVNLSTPKAAVEVPSAAPTAAPTAASAAATAAAGHGFKAPAPTIFPGDEIREMDRMRKLIADHMVMSKHVAPHVTSFVEADVTAIVRWREKVKSGYEKREGEKLTFTPIFMEAVVKAIKDFPNINVSVDGNNIVYHKPINLGMATALPSGNLIVPVIKNADRLSLSGMTKEVNELANRARSNALKPDDIQGGTYTVTNVGSFGNILGTPIINQPQVAILALGAIRKMPAVVETAEGDVIAIRHKMFLSHSYDHRVVDGALGGMFVRRVADYLEQWDPNREI